MAMEDEHGNNRYMDYLDENFEIMEKLGEGGCGEVFKVEDLRDEKEYALKKIRIDTTPPAMQTALEKLRLKVYGTPPRASHNPTPEDIDGAIWEIENVTTEAVNMERVSPHQNVVELHEWFLQYVDESEESCGEEDQVIHPDEERVGLYLYLKLELCEKNLEELGSFDFLDKEELLLQLLTALAHIHANDVAHVDVQSRNIMVKLVDEKLVFKVADFGASVSAESRNEAEFKELKRKDLWETSAIYGGAKFPGKSSKDWFSVLLKWGKEGKVTKQTVNVVGKMWNKKMDTTAAECLKELQEDTAAVEGEAYTAAAYTPGVTPKTMEKVQAKKDTTSTMLEGLTLTDRQSASKGHAQGSAKSDESRAYTALEGVQLHQKTFTAVTEEATRGTELLNN